MESGVAPNEPKIADDILTEFDQDTSLRWPHQRVKLVEPRVVGFDLHHIRPDKFDFVITSTRPMAIPMASLISCA